MKIQLQKSKEIIIKRKSKNKIKTEKGGEEPRKK